MTVVRLSILLLCYLIFSLSCLSWKQSVITTFPWTVGYWHYEADAAAQWSWLRSGLDCTATRVLFVAKAVRTCWSTFTSHSCETLTVCCRRLNHCQSIPAGTWRSRFCSSRRAGRFWQQRNLCCGRNHKPISQSAELMQKLQHGIFVAEGELEWKLLLHTKTLAGIKQLGKYLNLQTQLQ